jgi:hypothetical protein
VVLSCLCFAELHAALFAQGGTETCPRPSHGSTVTELEDLRRRNGALKVELTARNEKQKYGSTRYCFIDAPGRASPTLRANPADLVILTLKNDLADFGSGAAAGTEDWIIENRSNEIHVFRIHQLHCMLLDYGARPVSEPFPRDPVNVPYYQAKALEYASVRLRMDFRDANTIGDFVYHRHLLEHEDGGRMGLIRVEP